MSKRRKKNKNNQNNIPPELKDVITVPFYTPEPEFPKFRYLTSYKIGEEYTGWSYKPTGKHVIRSQERVLQYKKSKDGDWYDIPEESEAVGPNDTGRFSMPFWF
jgi:hypothetical protein